MSQSASDEDILLSSLWAIRLDETDTPAPSTQPQLLEDDFQFLRFVLDVPPIDFQPRLSRFDEAA